MREYRENPSTKEAIKPIDLLKDPKRFNNAERKAFLSMKREEVTYLRDECFINKYVTHLRRGANGTSLGADFPVLVVKGTKLQLERFKMTFLLSLIDYKGIEILHPLDFALGKEAWERAQDFEGVVIIKIPYGSSTTENFDQFRSDLIANVLTVRREHFNPTLVLTEQSIAGMLNTSCELIRVVELDLKKLRGSYDGSVQKVDTSVASRANKPQQTTTFVRQENRTPHVPQQQSSYYNNNNSARTSWGKQKKKSAGLNVNELANQLEQYMDEER